MVGLYSACTYNDTTHHSSADSESIATSLLWWTLAMIAFPEVQRRAQAEIDAVVGRDRLPTFADAPRAQL
jgi:Cytochrome P450